MYNCPNKLAALELIKKLCNFAIAPLFLRGCSIGAAASSGWMDLIINIYLVPVESSICHESW